VTWARRRSYERMGCPTGWVTPCKEGVPRDLRKRLHRIRARRFDDGFFHGHTCAGRLPQGRLTAPSCGLRIGVPHTFEDCET